MSKRKIFFCLTTILAFTLLSLSCFADTKEKITGAFIPANIPDPDTARSINIVQIKGGSGNLDSESLVGGDNNALINGWTVDTTGKTTYTVSKIILNTGQSEPNLTVANYTLSTSIQVETSGGEYTIDLGSPNAHNGTLPSDFYSDHFDGTNNGGVPEDTASPDGFYLVEETSDSTGHQKYRGIVSIPYMVEAKTGTTNDAEMVYDVHLYPKFIPSLGFGFHLYPNIVNVGQNATVTDRFASRSTTPGEFDYSHWLVDSVMNGSQNNWTLGMDISHEVLDQLQLHNTNVTNSWRLGLWSGSGYTNIMVGENTSDRFKPSTSSPPTYDGGILNSRDSWSFDVGVIFTNLNTGEREYFQLNYGSGSGAPSSLTYKGKTLHFNKIQDNTHGFYEVDNPGRANGMLWDSSNVGDLSDFFGINNVFGGDYAGLDLLDPASGYATMLTITRFTTSYGLKFSPEYLSDDLTTPLPKVRPTIYGFYGLNGNEKTGNLITTYGTESSVQNGFTNGDVKGQADGYGEFGVIRDYGYVTTGALNAIKLSEENEPLAGAQFVVKVKANADGVTGTPGQSGVAGDMLTPDQYLIISASDGQITTTTNIGNATKITSSNTVAVYGKIQAVGIDEDVNYQLIEVTAPVGYQMLKSPLQIPSTNVSHTNWNTDKADDDLIQIINLPTVVLPVTGGTSLWIMLLIGAGLVGIGFVVKHNKKR